MKIKFSGNNINVSITDSTGDSIYAYQANAFSVELDVTKLVESIDEIQQAVFDTIDKTLNEPTPPEA